MFGLVVWVESWASSKIGEAAAAATATMRRLVVFLLGSDATMTMGQALLFGPFLVVFLLGSDATMTMGQALLFGPCLVFLLQR